jgi:hypothetical protein
MTQQLIELESATRVTDDGRLHITIRRFDNKIEIGDFYISKEDSAEFAAVITIRQLAHARMDVCFK